MKALLASTLGCSVKVDGKWIPSVFLQQNGMLSRLQAIWKTGSKVLLLCADPADHDKNDSLCACLETAFPMSELSISSLSKCDDRNPCAIDDLENADVLVLSGGHVPTQNRFFQQLRLKQRLSAFQGLIIAWSAGSMNCADTVYAAPELPGEAADPLYRRWIPGLGITCINILPHFQALRNDVLDGLRLTEDIAIPDSEGQEIFALSDGSYIFLDGETSTLYGEAYLIKDRNLTQICKDGQFLPLKNR